ncbi:MAG TPA: ribosome maturation factor RimM [Longimicrobiaceae bacterium]|nr:ribosome maturation factor RimM [Longimicrobiaceae bacterium]
MPDDGHLIVGAVQKPHGIKGELFVRVETDHPQAVFAAGRVLLLGDAAGRPDGGTLTVERARPFKGGLLVKVAEHGGRTPAQDELRGRSLLIPAREAAPVEADEVFYHQLVGLRVVADGETVGKVREVYEAPGGLLLGVERAGRRELLLPFVRELVRRVDVEGGVLELDAPPGLLEL